MSSEASGTSGVNNQRNSNDEQCLGRRGRRRSSLAQLAGAYFSGADVFANPTTAPNKQLAYADKARQRRASVDTINSLPESQMSGMSSNVSERDAKVAATFVSSSAAADNADESAYWFVIHPIKSKFRRDWDLLLCVLIIYNALAVPYRISFSTEQPNWVQVLDYLVDSLFMIDIPLNFITGFVYKGETILSPSRIARNYATTFLVPDCLSIIPFELIQSQQCAQSTVETTGASLSECSLGDMNGLFKAIKLFRLARILRVLRLARIVKRFVRTLQIKHSVLSIVRFILIIIVAAHWITCAWVLTAQFNDYGDRSWMRQVGEWESRSRSSWYLVSLYSTVMIMATIGSNIQPVNDEERAVYMVSMLIGASCFAYGITNMCSLLYNLNHREVAYRDEVDELNEFLMYRNLPKHVSYRCREYFEYLHSRNRFFDEGKILDKLSPTLRQDCVLHINETIIRSNAFFSTLDDAFISTIIMNLRKFAFIPDEVIVQQGEVGNEMFFVSEGIVEIFVDGVPHAVGRLGPGDYFGEIALFRADSVRTASIKAASFCDIFSLSRDTVDEVLRQHPSSRARWYAIAAERMDRLEEAIKNVDGGDDVLRDDASDKSSRSGRSEAPPPSSVSGSSESSHGASFEKQRANRRSSLFEGVKNMVSSTFAKPRHRTSSVVPGNVTVDQTALRLAEEMISGAAEDDDNSNSRDVEKAQVELPNIASTSFFTKEDSASHSSHDVDESASLKGKSAFEDRKRRNSRIESDLCARLGLPQPASASAGAEDASKKRMSIALGQPSSSFRRNRRRSSLLRQSVSNRLGGDVTGPDYQTMAMARAEESLRWEEWLHGIRSSEQPLIQELRDEVHSLLLRLDGILSRTGATSPHLPSPHRGAGAVMVHPELVVAAGVVSGDYPSVVDPTTTTTTTAL